MEPDEIGPWSALEAYIDWEGGMGDLLDHGIEDHDIPVPLREQWKSMAEAYASFSWQRDAIYRRISKESEKEWRAIEALRNEG